MTRKLLLSLLVIGAVVAAVGLITYAIFSDNVASDDQVFTAGTVDIVVNEDEDDYFDTSLDMPNMEPGDCKNMNLHVANAGTLDVYLWNWIYTWGDLFGCDPNPACNMYVQKTFVDESSPPDGQEKIAVGGWENWKLEACLPLCAGNNCQGETGTMRMFFHAVQQSNLDGYTCIKLEDKNSGGNWIPEPLTPPHGNICYKVVGSDLDVVVNAYGLTPNACFQLDLSGGDTNDPYDADCQAQDHWLAAMSGDIYTAGYWNWGSVLEASCTVGSGGEGVWNFAGVYGPPGVCADANGDFSWSGTLSNLHSGSYYVKHNVKEITSPWPGTAWTGVLYGLDYLQFTIP